MPPCLKADNLSIVLCDDAVGVDDETPRTETVGACQIRPPLFLLLGRIRPLKLLDQPGKHDVVALKTGTDLCEEQGETDFSSAVRDTRQLSCNSTEPTIPWNVDPLCFALCSDTLQLFRQASSQCNQRHSLESTKDLAFHNDPPRSDLQPILEIGIQRATCESLDEPSFSCPPPEQRDEKATTAFATLVPTAEELISCDLFDEKHHKCNLRQNELTPADVVPQLSQSRIDDSCRDSSNMNTLGQLLYPFAFDSPQPITGTLTSDVEPFGIVPPFDGVQPLELEQNAVLPEQIVHVPIACLPCLPQEDVVDCAQKTDNHAFPAVCEKTIFLQRTATLDISDNLKQESSLQLKSEVLRLKDLMQKSRESQQLLQSWDRLNGLPRSHSWTMMHSNRSRRQLEENRILPKWNGKLLIDENGIAIERTRKKCKKQGRKRKHSFSEAHERSCLETEIL